MAVEPQANAVRIQRPPRHIYFGVQLVALARIGGKRNVQSTQHRADVAEDGTAPLSMHG
jgi:hypothetical protein